MNYQWYVPSFFTRTVIRSRNDVLDDKNQPFITDDGTFGNDQDIPQHKGCVYETVACRAWYTLTDEYTNVLNNDLPENDACRVCNTVND